MFLKAINCEGEYKDKHFISNMFIESIREIGPQNVVQVITNNTSACKAAGLLVEAKYRHIFWTPCVVHTLSLALKNICSPSAHPRYDDMIEQCGWITKISSNALFIKNFIMNHSMRLAMFKDHSKLKLLSIADTHFASTIVTLKRFKQIKQDLEQMVISEKWDVYKEEDVEKARAVKKKVLDEYFWVDIDYILNFTAPIYEMLRMANTDTPCLHLVYEWTESSTPLHCLAYSLNPRYYSNKWLKDAPGRVAPHQDFKIAKERKKCLERYFSNAEERRSVNKEYAEFSLYSEDFSSGDSMKDRDFMAPRTWWAVHGASTPTLQSIALKLLGQPCSSSSCERNWSTYNFMHSLRRNKITPQRGEDLVYVHNNLRLLSRRSPTYNEGVSQLWDVGGDGFDSMDMENVGILEIADLSLNEPELEAVLFSSTDNLNDDV
ncbi:hypothetical protein LWI28_023056 [Acer negundo]|uniref:HAT C-terminal dimerisation domain-containing protein n=1 Tax=Acer negundo TaxID=4023 RepID=A0AAD5JF09_ACENE|nr:hypothetical protein LWI28_023056 [Acer negundo]